MFTLHDNRRVNPAPNPSPVTHYENFPVASWLCPPRLRAPIAAIYHFARTADDLADEGGAPPAQRLADLAAYRADLAACYVGADAISAHWPQVFGPLHRAITAFGLPEAPLADLLDAFAQDVTRTRGDSSPAPQYADRADLLDYCRRSANPVGRLLLHLYGITDTQALAQSDAICTALQLTNFWQDLSVDIPRGRHYLCAADRAAYGVADADLAALRQTPNATKLIANCVDWARTLMQKGTPLVHRVPGRAGWELRLVVQGGMSILDKIAALHHATLRERPCLGATDAPRLLWRALWM